MNIYAIDRKKTIKNYYDINELEDAPCGSTFAYTTSRYQYFVAQLVVVSDFDEQIDVITSPLTGEGQELTRAVSCLNTSGINAEGLFFYQKIKLYAGRMQPLFIGFDLSETKLGTFTTSVSIGGKKVKLTLHLNDDLVFNDGADDIYSGGRLKWLNSTLGVKDTPVKGYNPLALEDNRLLFTGKEAVIGNDGLLADVISYFTPSNSLSSEKQNNLFYKPMEFVVEGQRYRFAKQRVSGKGTAVSYSAEGRGDATRVEVYATARYEGYIDYKVKLIADKDIIIDNIALNLYFSACAYSVGLGKKGGYFQPTEYKWDNTKQQDSVFVGDINCGARIRFKDKQEVRPFEAEYYAYKPCTLPVNSWDNRGKGSISLSKSAQGAALTAKTGRIILAAGKACEFCFELHLTPFKQPDLKRQFAFKSFTTQDTSNLEKQLERASWYQCNVLSLGWLSNAYQYVNYPFLTVSDIKKAISVAQSKGFSTTLDYSLGQTSANNPELNILKSFGDEFLFRGGNDTNGCIVQRLGEGIVSSQKKSGKKYEVSDISVLLQTDSRLDNYFVEAVNYIYQSLRIEGVNIEGSHISRGVAERIKRVSDTCGAAMGITLKENNDMSKNAFASPLNLHTHILPFTDKLSVDGSFVSGEADDYMLTEVSGLVYGITAEAVSPLFNPLEALLYGMTLRGGMSNAKTETYLDSLYRVLKEFNILESCMYGYWDNTNPVSTDKKEVKLTSYIVGENLLAVVYNQSGKGIEFDIGINPKLGYTSKNKQITLPLIIGLQNQKIINFNKSFYLKSHQGMIMLIK